MCMPRTWVEYPWAHWAVNSSSFGRVHAAWFTRRVCWPDFISHAALFIAPVTGVSRDSLDRTYNLHCRFGRRANSAVLLTSSNGAMRLWPVLRISKAVGGYVSAP